MVSLSSGKQFSVENGHFVQDIVIMNDNDTTPDVSGGNVFFTGNASGLSPTITNLDNASEG